LLGMGEGVGVVNRRPANVHDARPSERPHQAADASELPPAETAAADVRVAFYAAAASHAIAAASGDGLNFVSKPTIHAPGGGPTATVAGRPGTARLR
jgi:hypothetical protein